MINKLKRITLNLVILYFSKIQFHILESSQDKSKVLLLLIALIKNVEFSTY